MLGITEVQDNRVVAVSEDTFITQDGACGKESTIDCFSIIDAVGPHEITHVDGAEMDDVCVVLRAVRFGISSKFEFCLKGDGFRDEFETNFEGICSEAKEGG